jgi:hypothetical protein
MYYILEPGCRRAAVQGEQRPPLDHWLTIWVRPRVPAFPKTAEFGNQMSLFKNRPNVTQDINIKPELWEKSSLKFRATLVGSIRKTAQR